MKNSKLKYKKAFTLAEVLITLTIVGIVASLTIPSLVNNVNNTTSVVQLKKTYATLQQAFMLVQADNGGSIVSVFQSDTTTNYGNGNALNTFLTKLNYVKNCGNSTGCWYDTPAYYLNGTLWTPSLETSWIGKNEKAILANGAMIHIRVDSANCTSSAGTGPLNNSSCGLVSIDLNGAKPPNTRGRDFFLFWITQTGIYPAGSFDGYYCSISSGDVTSSGGCAAKVLTEGAMNY